MAAFVILCFSASGWIGSNCFVAVAKTLGYVWLPPKEANAFTRRRLSLPKRCVKTRVSLGRKQRFITVVGGERCALKRSLLFTGGKELSAERCAYWSLLRPPTAIINRERCSTARQLTS